MDWSSHGRDHHVLLPNGSEQIIFTSTSLNLGLQVSLDVCFHLVNVNGGSGVIGGLEEFGLWRIPSRLEGSLLSELFLFLDFGIFFSFFLLNKSVVLLLSFFELLLFSHSALVLDLLLRITSLGHLDHFAEDALL